MRCNLLMQQLLQCCLPEIHVHMLPDRCYTIWMKVDRANRPYYGTADFCGLDRRPVPADENLSRLEWDGNEVRLSAEPEGCTADLLRKMMDILAFWQAEMEEKYPAVSFFLMASYDDGEDAVYEADDEPAPSITLRFWADRGDSSVADPENLENYAQPVLLQYVSATVG